MKTLCLIPARSGSKGIANKNLRLCGCRPLIAWSIEAAQQAGLTPVVSSDSAGILSVAQGFGALTILRPAELAMDDSSTVDVVLHAANYLLEHPSCGERYDAVVCLQPTSPLRSVETIKAGLKMLEHGKCVVACRAVHLPEVAIDEQGHVELVAESLHRQGQRIRYIATGSFYGCSVKQLNQYKSFYTPETVALMVSEDEALDVDTAHDMLVADLLLRHRMEQARVLKVGEVNE